MTDQLTNEWQEGVLFCELRDYETGGITDTVIYGDFRIDEYADVQQKVGDGQRKLCDMLNALDFTALPADSLIGVRAEETYHVVAAFLTDAENRMKT